MGKKKGKVVIPMTLLVGILVMGAFYFIYGWEMLLRYLLGGLMFATITVLLITLVKKYFGKKKVVLW